MKIQLFLPVIFLTIILLIQACDKGISPDEPTPTISGVSGTVYFQNWPPPGTPPPDSLVDVRLILFRYFPPDSIQNEILTGRAVLFPALNASKLSFYIDSLNFQISLAAGTYEYFAVAHQYGPNLFGDWQVVGHYDTDLQDTLPTPLTIASGQLLENIIILANFDSVLFKL